MEPVGAEVGVAEKLIDNVFAEVIKLELLKSLRQ